MKRFRNIFFLLLLVSASTLTGCKEEKGNELEEQIDLYDDGKGQFVRSCPIDWKVNEEEFSPISSMTITTSITGLETTVNAKDRMVAMVNGKCRGVAEAEFMENSSEPLFFLLISLPESEVKAGHTKIELKYYSATSKKVYTASETVNYLNDTFIGLLEEPYAPIWR